MAQISAFSMSFEPASPVCVQEYVKQQQLGQIADHLMW